jgi:prepilin-type N-terminal cleavage/methylation domain-containing protein
MKRQKGFSLLEIVATLVVIVGVIAATGYYRGRPASDPTSIDASLPNIAEATRKIAQTNYYLEGTVHKVVRNVNGAYFMVETASGKRLYVVGTQALSGGLSQVAAGQVAAMQVQLNMGSSLTASVQVVSPAQAVDVFVYKYMVKSPAPAHYVDPEADEPQETAAPSHTADAQAKDDG